MSDNIVNFNVIFNNDFKALDAVESRIKALFQSFNFNINVFQSNTTNVADNVAKATDTMDRLSNKMNVSIDDLNGLSGGFNDLSADIEQVTEVVEDATDKTGGFLDSFKKFSSIASSLNNVIGLAGKAISTMQEFAAANEAQQEAEAKLAQVMRNTMAASDSEIQSIKDLASAQQKIGVIGDEVQLAGAQALGAHLKNTDSLKALVPAMNDILAKQKGFNASQEDAASLGNQLGKALGGEIGSLKECGLNYDKAQEQLLKYGTEEQKVATLADIVQQQYGGMNEALAQTPEGKLHQVSNDMGDVKERVGKLWADLSAKLVPAFDSLINLANRLIDIVSKGWPVWIAASIAAVVAIAKVKSSLTPVIAKLGATSLSAIGTGGAFTVMGSLAKAACRGISTAIASIPIVGWIAGAITLAIGLFTTLWNKCEGFREVVMGVWEVVKTVFQSLWNTIATTLQNIWNTVSGIAKGIAGAFQTAFAWIYNNVLQPLWNFFGGFADFVKNIIDKVVDWLAGAFQPIIDLWNKISGKASSTYQKGAQKGRDSYRNDQQAKQQGAAGIAPIAAGAAPDIAAAAPSAAATGKAEAVATGGTRNTQITLNLGKMVENIVFNGSLQDNAQSLQQQVEEILLRSLYAAQTAAN